MEGESGVVLESVIVLESDVVDPLAIFVVVECAYCVVWCVLLMFVGTGGCVRSCKWEAKDLPVIRANGSDTPLHLPSRARCPVTRTVTCRVNPPIHWGDIIIHGASIAMAN